MSTPTPTVTSKISTYVAGLAVVGQTSPKFPISLTDAKTLMTEIGSTAVEKLPHGAKVIALQAQHNILLSEPEPTDRKARHTHDALILKVERHLSAAINGSTVNGATLVVKS